MTTGPIARAVDDLEAMLPYFIMPDPKDPVTQGLPSVGDSRWVNLKGLRVAYFARWAHGRGNPTAEVEAAVTASAEALAREGANVEWSRPDFFDKTFDIGDAVVLRDTLPIDTFREFLAKWKGTHDPQMQGIIEWAEWRAKELPEDKVKSLLAEEWPRWQDKFLEFMDKYDVLLTPVSATPALKHRTWWHRDVADGLSWTYAASLVDSVPSGTVRVAISSEGLPIGVQVIGSPFREDKVLRVLRHCETLCGFQPSLLF